jgi:hypothetical protein
MGLHHEDLDNETRLFMIEEIEMDIRSDTLAHAAAGASGARHSLRPLKGGRTFIYNSGALRRDHSLVMPGLDPGIHPSS